ncbi:damage-inducible protein DinB [Spirosoma sp. HMF3257]|uniref:Damage-inducible protein DinB n=1 Tax=Spirosoma telluris TaxID=2183553 RepID=A0A327NWU9_9BACT|nr:damage-inducible protein DinB [Spirosoma telluris]RAI77358.1 damage-inducible protein DinB [Spirosoma telluris]
MLTKSHLRFLRIFLGLFWAFTAVQAAAPLTTISQLTADWQRAKEYTKEYLDAMPEDGVNFKPTPEIRSFAEQMLHLTAANYNFGALASGKANPMQGKKLEEMTELKNKAALTKAVMDSYDFMIDAVKGMTDAQLAESVKMGQREMTKEVVLAKAFEHQTHHRGQCTIYIRMKGIKPPNEKLF